MRLGDKGGGTSWCSGAVRPRRGEGWGQEAVLPPVTGKGLIEALTQKHRAAHP